MFIRAVVIIIILILSFTIINGQNVVINEVMSSNSFTIIDEDGDYPDWIELYNYGTTPIDLNGFGLSDDITEPLKWTFPQVTIQPDDYLLLFASDKNRINVPNIWETVIDWGDIWKYRLGLSEPPTNWNTVEYDDLSWDEGPSGFGYGDEDDATEIAPIISVYVRKSFTISDTANIILAVLHVDFDDAFVAYLNGYEIARENIGVPGVPPGYQETAITYTEPKICYGENPFQYIISNIQTLLQTGENVLSIQVHNSGIESSDLTLIPFLTLGMNTTPAEPHGVNELIVNMLPKLHTNFKISSSGETLILTSPAQTIVDELYTGELPVDISKGRQPDGSSAWFFFDEPTPEASNSTTGYQSIASDVQFSQNGGFFSSSFLVLLSGNNNGETIYYTTDGSEPTSTSTTYINPILIDETKIIRAIMLGDGVLPGKIITNTYFMNETSTLPVISISSTPANFWDTDSGIYVMGENAEPDFPYFGANFWENWERPINIELFETDGNQVLNSGAGVKIFGGWSRGFEQKSISIFARGKYGNSEFNYQLFSEKPIDVFETFLLRNSGNDWGITMFRDALMTGLLKSVDLERQAYRPAVVYLNGEYWGIHNIREKVNEHFIASNNPGVDPDNIDELESNAQVIEGDNEHYMAMLNFLENSDLSIQQNYEIVKTLMEVDNFISYQVAQIYFDNTDWPGNNIKYWRPKIPEGRWRWIIYDTDFGFGIWNESNYLNNTLAFALEENGPDWPNPPWSTFLLRKLLENEEFKFAFINRFADYMNTIFKSDVVNDRIDEMQQAVEPEMSAHFSRWGGSVSDWNNNVNVLRTFANNRVTYLRLHIMNQFGISGLSLVNINVNSIEYGDVQLNSIVPENYPWNGYYFNQVPVTVEAIPKIGYRFSGWTGTVTSDDPIIEVIIDQNIDLTAHFEIDPANDLNIVINEFNYNSADDFNPEDWVEFYNKGENDVEMGGWIFKDEEDIHSFIFPENLILPPGGYIIICMDTVLFKNLFPDVNCISGQADFGLSGGGELIRLYNNEGYMIDSLIYDDVYPWPPEADGNGPTVALKDPEWDNSLPESWAASYGHGTPGVENDVLGIDVEGNKIPEKFCIKQNYPNPFNPETFIEFQLAGKSFVVMEVYDIIGRKIETLIHENLPAGYHKVKWKPAQSLGSGIYFYRINVDGKINNVKKMVLIK